MLRDHQHTPWALPVQPASVRRGISSCDFPTDNGNLLQGLHHVSIYLDDILVTGETEAEHLSNLEEVLRRLETAGMRLKRAKCAFMLPQVQYLGHVITSEGLQPTPEKVRAIQEAPVPRDVTQLKSFLGLVNYYGKFLPNLSTHGPLASSFAEAVQVDLGGVVPKTKHFSMPRIS